MMKDAVIEFVDVSHTLEEGVITYPGLPAPTIGHFLTREQSQAHYALGTEFHIGRIDMVANTGTYVDAPFHRYSNGADLSELPLHKLANLEGLVVRIAAESQPAIDASFFHDLPLVGRAVLIHTGWSRYWNSDRYFEGHPYLTEDSALYLRDNGAVMVGIDSLNIDDTAGGRRPVHSILLQAEIPVVEHLTRLDQLPDQGFRFFAVPVKVKRLGSFPVRAFGLVPAAPPTSHGT
jgi:kynurenine formamidase